MSFSIHDLKTSLSASKHNHVLFYSPVLRRLVVPFSVQTDLFDSNGFSSHSADKVRYVCNTRTKVRNPVFFNNSEG